MIILGLGIIIDTNNKSTWHTPLQYFKQSIFLSILVISFEIMFISIIQPDDKVIISTPQSQLNQTYTVSKSGNVYISKNNKLTLYTNKIETIEYQKGLTKPKIELTTIKHYRGLEVHTWEIGKREITYSTHISKLTLPSNDIDTSLVPATTLSHK